MNRLHEGDQILPQAGENAGHVYCFGARFVVVQERVVRDAVASPAAATEGGRLFALESDDLFEPRAECLKLGFLASFDPVVLGQGGDARNLFNQLFGEFGGPIVASAGLAHVRPSRTVRFAEVILLFQFADQRAQAGSRESVVNHSRQQAQLFGAMRNAARREIRLLVPRKLGRGRQNRPLPPLGHQLVVKLVRRSHLNHHVQFQDAERRRLGPARLGERLPHQDYSTSTRSGAGGAEMSGATSCFSRRRALYQSTTIGMTEITRMAAITKWKFRLITAMLPK